LQALALVVSPRLGLQHNFLKTKMLLRAHSGFLKKKFEITIVEN
jgi:hypothetical protein